MAQLDELEILLLGKDSSQGLARSPTSVDEDLAQAPPGLFLLDKGCLELLGGKKFIMQEQCAKARTPKPLVSESWSLADSTRP